MSARARRRAGESGYVMAAALAALIVMSLVAATLVSVSVNELRRVRVAESAAAADAVLDAAILRAAAELAKDPRRRRIAFVGGRDRVVIDDVSVNVTASWEGERLDVNRAAPETVREALRAAGAPALDADAVATRLRAARARGPVRRLDAIAPDGTGGAACAQQLLTVFGGREEPAAHAQIADGTPFARPPPGARVRVRVSIADGAARRARETVLLMTGDPRAPTLVMDTRRVRATDEGACDDATT